MIRFLISVPLHFHHEQECSVAYFCENVINNKGNGIVRLNKLENDFFFFAQKDTI